MDYRIAVEKDIDFLVQSRMDFIEIGSAHLGYGFMQKSCLHYFQESFENGSFEAVIAEEDGRLAGLGMIFYYRSVPSQLNPTGWNGYITNLFVEEPFRKQGVGTELIQRLVRQAKKRNCYIIMLHASEMGMPVYEKMGFKKEDETETHYIMEKRIEEKL